MMLWMAYPIAVQDKIGFSSMKRIFKIYMNSCSDKLCYVFRNIS